MSIDGQVADIDRMGDREFEYFVADLWRRQGYDAHPTQRSGDGGVDIVADNREERLAIEAKWRSDGKIGPGWVRKVAGVASRPEFDGGVLVTNTEFTDAAYREANDMDVKLVDGEGVVTLDRQTRRTPPNESTSSERAAGIVGAAGLAMGALGSILLYIIEDPERLVDLLRVLLILFVGYIIVDAFGGVLGFNLPGGV